MLFLNCTCPHLTFNDDIQMAVGRFVNKRNLPKGEFSYLSSVLITKFGNNVIYGEVI